MTAISIDRAAYNQGINAKYDFAVEYELAQPLVARGPGGVMDMETKINGGGSCMNDQEYVVRRLTPIECERLQGYPDGWTDIGEWTDTKGKKHKAADTPRYHALGNSVALPFWQVLARRITAQYDRNCTMGSLFDGIGGFPLVFSRVGCEPVWASEIDEFCIAVTKRRFPE